MTGQDECAENPRTSATQMAAALEHRNDDCASGSEQGAEIRLSHDLAQAPEERHG